MNTIDPPQLDAFLMNPQTQAQLSQLRDIDLPEQISWWPLAAGWWVLLIALICTGIGFVWYRIKRARSRRYQALRELKQIRLSSKQAASLQLASQLSVLLHRFINVQQLADRPHSQSAWQAYLSGDNPTQGRARMSTQVAAFLTIAPYCDEHSMTSEAVPSNELLLSSTEQFIRRF